MTAAHWCGWEAPPVGDPLEALGWHRVECAAPAWSTDRRAVVEGALLPPVVSKPKLGRPVRTATAA